MEKIKLLFVFFIVSWEINAQCPYNVPYFEGFESGYTHFVGLSGCITQQSNSGADQWKASATYTDYNTAPRAGTWNAVLYSDNEDWIFIPVLLQGGKSYTLSLSARQDGTAPNATIMARYGTSTTSSSMTAIVIPQTNLTAGAYQNMKGNFTPYATGIYYIMINGTINSSSRYISLDDISLLETACTAPVVWLTGFESTSASFTWNDIGAFSYEYAINQSALPPSSGTSTNVRSFNATSLTPSTQYYFHVRAICATGGEWATYPFSTASGPPVNDDCVGAILLIPGSNFADNEVIASNVDATNSTFPSAPCANYTGGDVWYKVAVPNSGNLTIETNNDCTNGGVVFDTGMAIYGGLCAALSGITCNDDGSSDIGFSKATFSGRIPGEVLYIRVWEPENDVFGTFRISAYDSTLSADEFDKSNFQAYPNPVKGILNLSNISEISSVEIYNMLGQKVLSKDINLTQGQVDMSNLTAGNYIVKVIAGEATTTVKVVKQ